MSAASAALSAKEALRIISRGGRVFSVQNTSGPHLFMTAWDAEAWAVEVGASVILDWETGSPVWISAEASEQEEFASLPPSV